MFKYALLGTNLDKNFVWLLDPAPFFENFTKLYFDTKHKKQAWAQGSEICGALFSEKVPVMANIRCCPNLCITLDLALPTKSFNESLRANSRQWLKHYIK